MDADSKNKTDVFNRAWKIIEQDTSIPPEDKESILKLIKALIEAAESAPYPNQKNAPVKTFTQEIISRHALMSMVKQQADELDALKDLSLNLTSSLDLQTVLNAVVSEAMRLVRNARAAHIYLYSNRELSFGASLNVSGVVNKPISTPRPNGITYLAAHSGERIIVEDMANHPLYKNAPKEWAGSIVSIPLRSNDSIVGVMNLSRSITGGFNKSEMRLLGLLADQAAVAISNARLHKIVKDLANTDSITGLPNRRALDERLQEEVRYAQRMRTEFAVVMMDLDGFKNVNDTFGHAVGDDVLRSLFNYLARNMRETDFLARYGGDELTLVMRNTGLKDAEAVAHKIIELVQNYKFPFPNNREINLGITAGIAVYPLHTRITGDLLRAADAALYQGKKHRRGEFIIAKGVTGPLGAVTLLRTPKK
ncbi:MAG: sensor domain-containing diguanylate cyclase [Anaerolineales bacterium]|nr:sensor domain-containing diguanylate cyclase [Anaerolineales bacterium]